MRTIRFTLLLCSLLGLRPLAAQKQYWGLATQIGGASVLDPFRYGGMYRVDSNALNLELVLPFDTLLGTTPIASGILQASNGLIYGITTTGAQSGHLFSFDPVTDSVRTPVALGSEQYPHAGQTTNTNLIEGSPGILFGTTTGSNMLPGTVFRYSISSETIDLITALPSDMQNGNTYPTAITGPLLMASNGKLFGVRSSTQASFEKIARVDPGNNMYSQYDYEISNGWRLNPDLKESEEKFYGTMFRGGLYDGGFSGDSGTGTIVEFDPVTNSLSKKLDFNDSVHNPWRGFLATGNGVWYGEAVGSPWDGNGVGLGATGCLYAYNPTWNTLYKLVDYATPPLGPEVTGNFNLGALLAASNGRLYGSFSKGLFEYDPIADTLSLRANMQFYGTAHGSWSPMIEICRKPNYKPRSTTSFNVCAGAYFFYDLHNVNATSVVWRRNGTVVAGQTDQMLEFAAITEADEGMWECTMTNECGTTVPPPITITVNAGAFITGMISGDTLLCGNGDSAVLTGNNGGTWTGPLGYAVNGATTPGITATLPGTYYVWNTQACGISFSNTIQLLHLDSAVAPQLTYPAGLGDVVICPANLPFIVEGNDPGPWNNQPIGLWQDGSAGSTFTAQDTGLVYVVAANACNSDTSALTHLVFDQGPPPLQITITDVPFGQSVDTYLCGNESLFLSCTQPDFYPMYSDGQYVASLGGGDFAQPHQVDSAGVFHVITFVCGLPTDTLVIAVYADSLPPNATILPDQEVLIGCDQDTLYLSSSYPNSYWTWYDEFATLQTDTAEHVEVYWGGFTYTMTPFNGCGDGPQDVISIQGTPAPDVQYTEAVDSVCLSAGIQTLSGGTPASGTYSGPGVSGNNFDPVVAGIGTHTITYAYSDGTCTGYAQDAVVVDICAGLVPLSSGQGPVVSVFPNPNQGCFAIQLSGGFRRAHASLFNSMGQEVMASVLLHHKVTTVHMADLPVGVHTMRIVVDERTHTVRLVIAR